MSKAFQVFFILLSIPTFLSSCQQCKECTLTELAGTPNETTTDLGEKCGDELDEVDGKTYVAIDGPVSSQCQ
jgi:hypothetical protein